MWFSFRRVARVVALASLLLAACSKLPEGYPTPTPVLNPSISNKPTYTVQRGMIEQVVTWHGRIASDEEDVLYFRQAGRLYHLYVDPDQKVKKGDLVAELDTGPLENQVKTAQVQLDIAQLKVDQAMGKNGTDQQEPASVSAARTAVAKAEADVARAQDALNSLLDGPTSADVAAARAGSSVAEAQLAQAQQNLSTLKAQPRPEDVRTAQLALEQAQNTLWSAQVNRDAACGANGAQSTQCKSTDATVGAQQAAVGTAQIKLDQAKQPVKPEQITAAWAAMTSAQANVAATQAKLSLLKRGPTANDVDAAKQNLASAQAELDGAQAGLHSALGSIAGTSIDVQIVKKQADVAKLQLAELQRQLDETQLRAPFDGVVSETDAKDGDQIQSNTPVLTVSNPAKLQIAVEPPTTDLTNVNLGQRATIVLSAYPTTLLTGKVVRMPSIATANTPNLPANLRTVRLSFTPPTGPVNLGDLATVTIDVQRKEGVLVLPSAAIRTFGGYRFVSVLTPDNVHRDVDIQIGMSDDTNTEITQGLQDGDKVISP